MKTFILAVLLFPTVSFAQSENDWLPLENEPSRQQLAEMGEGIDLEVLPKQFIFPANATEEEGIFGIDLSHYTASGLPFDKLADHNIHFVYVKATQGTTLKDGKFGSFWSALDKLDPDVKVYRGAYHFLSSSSDGAAQAERFVAYVNLHGGFKADDMAPAMDLEWDKISVKGADLWKSHTSKQIIDSALAFMKRVEELTGRVPMIYTDLAWWKERRIPQTYFAKFSHYPLWIADYSKRALKSEVPAVPPHIEPNLWQFSSSAKMSGGYKGGVDANVFKGTEEEFLQTFFATTP